MHKRKERKLVQLYSKMRVNKGKEKGQEPEGIGGLRQGFVLRGKPDKKEDAEEKARESWTKKGPIDHRETRSTSAGKLRRGGRTFVCILLCTCPSKGSEASLGVRVHWPLFF